MKKRPTVQDLEHEGTSLIIGMITALTMAGCFIHYMIGGV